MAPYEVQVPSAQIRHYLGKTLRDQLAQLNAEYGLSLGYDEFSASVEHAKQTYLPSLRPKTGVLPLLRALRQAGIPIAIATSAPRQLAEKYLRTTGLEGFFQVVVTAEDVHAHKPAPDVYERAAVLLKVEARGCVVLEDAPSGILAARRARMRCVVVRTAYTTGVKFLDADLVVSSLSEVDLATFKSLVAPSQTRMANE
jgi:beta-phosphoglucomutase